MLLNGLIIILIPFLGTSLGSAVVLFSKGELNQKLQKFLLGFASGVMIAASIWSLLIPSIEMAESQNIVAWIPATVGFLLGIGFLLLLDSVIPHMHLDSDNPEGVRSSLSKNTMLVLAVTLHNIPEGMAVGVTFVGASIPPSELEFGEDEPEDGTPDTPRATGSSFDEIDDAVRAAKNPEATTAERERAAKVFSDMEGTELYEKLMSGSTELSIRIKGLIEVRLKKPKKEFTVPDNIDEFNIRDYV